MNYTGPNTLNSTFKNLFESKKWCDITFVVHGEEIKAHKLVVASRSPVFEAMIASDLAPKDGKHAIDDPEITFDDFQTFLEFLYTDSCAMTNENIDELIYLGNFYNVEYLIHQCVQYIEETFSSSTMLQYAELGLLYGDSCSLLGLCISKLPKSLAHCSLISLANGSEKWISPELAVKIVEKCPRTEDFTEDVLFKKIYEWAEKSQSSTEAEDIKAALTPLIPFIKFEDLNPITLATVVRDNKLLNSENLANALSAAVKRLEEEQRRQRKRKMSPTYSYGSPSQMKSPRYTTVSPGYCLRSPTYTPC